MLIMLFKNSFVIHDMMIELKVCTTRRCNDLPEIPIL